jgi:hypothetical protein
VTGDADRLPEPSEAVVDGWIEALTTAIAKRLTDRKLEQRLARITGRGLRPRDRLRSLLEQRQNRVAWRRGGRQHAKELQLLDKALREGATAPKVAAETPTIERIAADLRRLDRQRQRGPTVESSAWFAAVQKAYDQRLVLCCQALGLPEHLSRLQGIDQEIERVRIEGELQRSGLSLRTASGP